MAGPNPYDNCPCGSGKKFKWCCTAYWDKIETGLAMLEQGQVENALKMMEMLVKEHGTIPQTWGFYAHVLFRVDQVAKAEEMLEKAFALDPNFAMGYLLKGIFRQSEGEVIGALMLFRKAAECYSPEAADRLAQVHEMITQFELRLNRPVAAAAALARAVKFSPGDAEAAGQFETLFGNQSRLPHCARKMYALRATAQPADLPTSGRLSEVKKAYEDLTAKIPSDPAAWFNLGVVRAWLGDQGPALDALSKSLDAEYDDANAEETAALAEVLKCGQGMEADCDYKEYRYYLQIRDPNAVLQLLQAWDAEGRMMGAQSDENGQNFGCMLVEQLPSLVDTGTTMAKVLGNLTINGGLVRLWSGDNRSAQTLAIEMRDRLNMAVEEPVEGSGPPQFGEIVQEAFAYPIRMTEITEAEIKLKAFAENFFETVWAHRPLKVFGGASAIDAGGSKLLRKRLLGVIKFLEDCVAGSAPRKQRGEESYPMEVYDFNRLRHKLGAERQGPGAPPPELVAASKKKLDFGAMNTADLAGLKGDDLSGLEIEEAMRASLKLDARELAVAFAKAGIAKPFDVAKPDRYTLFACLMASANADGDSTAALQHATAGAEYDAANNAGKRANEFGLQKARLLAKSGQADAAVKEFMELIARNPDEAKFYIGATETMLSAKRGSDALRFAEAGLAKAKSTGNRDLEGACLELSEAAKRLK